MAGVNLAVPAANMMIFILYDPSGKLVAEDLGFIMGGGDSDGAGEWGWEDLAAGGVG